jgi:hypothetical protein
MTKAKPVKTDAPLDKRPHLIVREKGQRCVELTLRLSRGLQGRRDDRAGRDARRCPR